MFERCLFLFRRDLRLEDNTGLESALSYAKTVIAAFIFTPEQIEHNLFRSERCLQFMLESLADLQEQLKQKGGKLYLFEGESDKIVHKCIQELKVDAVAINRDYTPYSLQRDHKIQQVCQKAKIHFSVFDDALLHRPEDVLKSDGRPYSIFTPYFRQASKLPVQAPKRCEKRNYFHGSIPFALSHSPIDISSIPGTLKGGRSEGLKILKHLSHYQRYAKDRDIPAMEATTHLSPYLKFNVCSIREVYAAICRELGPHHELIRSLYWRDFFSAIAFFAPHVFKGAFRSQYNKLEWSNDKKTFQRWCDGMTGFPIVDAGMRELNATGFMHNRVRMITASFLIKDLHIDWRWGERYFAQHLIDYDPAVNNGNWQWVAGCGCDAQPYFRIFNPWSQQKKFDLDCEYIYRWIPELKSVPAKQIHSWDLSHLSYNDIVYPAPMLDHAKEAKKALKAYRI